MCNGIALSMLSMVRKEDGVLFQRNELLNGMVEWNIGMTTPIDWPVFDDLYPTADRTLAGWRSGVQHVSLVLESFGVSRRRLAQGDWHFPL